MEFEAGIIFAIIAMFAWGFGDFLIQKSTKKIGVWTTLFIITLTGFLVLTPFALKNAASLFTFGRNIFIVGGIAYLIAAFLDLEALKKGKLDVVEPIWSFEIVSAALLAFLFLGERITCFQIVFVILLIISLVLVSLKSLNFDKRFLVEKGVYLAFVAAVTMGIANFLIGVGSRNIDPITMKWGMDLFLAVGSFIFVLKNKELKGFSKKIKQNKKTILFMSLFDNSAWLAFGFAMALAPISIAVAISESYIIIAVLLGYFVNKESLRKHQIIGLILALISAIYLATSL